MTAGTNKQRRVAQLRPMTLDEIVQLPPPQWLVEGHLQADGLTVLFGAPGAGKTFIALDWALSVATGTAWLGCQTQPCEVVYIYAEGIRGISQRCKAWFKEHEIEAASKFRAIPCSVNMLDGTDRGFLATAIKDAKLTPGLIVIDTLARNFGGGDENQTKDMNLFINGCDDLRQEHFPGVTVVVIHHAGKNAKRGARGAIALTGAADAEFLIEKLRGSEDKLKLVNTKQKDSEALPDQRLQLVPVGESCVIRAPDAAEAAKAEAAEAAVRGTAKTDNAVFFALLPFGKGATYSQWREASNKAKATFDRSRDRLVTAGRVKHDGERYCCIVALDDPALDGRGEDDGERAS